VLALGSDAWAGPPTETLDQTFVTVNRLLEDPALQEKPPKLLEAIRKVVIDCFDVRQAASLALGREWHARTSTERDEFVQLFGDLLQQAYVSRIASRATVHGGLAIRYVGESVEGDRATVTATIASRDGNEIPVVYRMIQHGQRWAVYDVLIDGISLVVNYRAQLQRTIRQSSYSALVAMLKAKVSRTPTLAAVPAGAGEVSAGAGAPATQPAPRVEMASVPVPERSAGVDRDHGVNEVARRGPPELPASVPSAKQVAATSYWIQMGAFTNHEAGELASRLLRQSLPLAIDAVTAGRAGQLLLRVRVGPFSDRAEAASRLRDLQTKGYQPLIAHELD